MAEQCAAYEREWTLRRYAAAAAAEAAMEAQENLLRTPKTNNHHIQETVDDHRTRTDAVKLAKTKAFTHHAVTGADIKAASHTTTTSKTSTSSGQHSSRATSKTSGSATQ
jgi:hypothetical protein